jgi:hypothetical protein
MGRWTRRPTTTRGNANRNKGDYARAIADALEREFVVITLEDCIALCGLTEQEVLAIAEHEHVPEIVAAAMARYLLKEPHGGEKIRDMIRDDIRETLKRGDRDHARELFMTLRHFLDVHPAARRNGQLP